MSNLIPVNATSSIYVNENNQVSNEKDSSNNGINTVMNNATDLKVSEIIIAPSATTTPITVAPSNTISNNELLPSTSSNIIKASSSTLKASSFSDEAFLLRQEMKKLEILEKERDKLKNDQDNPEDDQETREFKKTRLVIIDKLVEDQKINIRIKNSTTTSQVQDESLQNKPSRDLVQSLQPKAKSSAGDSGHYRPTPTDTIVQSQTLSQSQQSKPIGNISNNVDAIPKNEAVPPMATDPIKLIANDIVSDNQVFSGKFGPMSSSNTKYSNDNIQDQQTAMRQTYDNRNYNRGSDLYNGESIPTKDKNKSNNIFRTYDGTGYPYQPNVDNNQTTNKLSSSLKDDSFGKIQESMNDSAYGNISLTKSEVTFKEQSPSRGKASPVQFDSPLSALIPRKSSPAKKVEFDLKSNQEIIIESNKPQQQYNAQRFSRDYPPAPSSNSFQDQDIQVKIVEIRERLEHYEKLLKESFERNNENERKIQQYENVIQQIRSGHQNELRELKDKNQKLLDEISNIKLQHQQDIEKLMKKNSELLKIKLSNINQDSISKQKSSSNIKPKYSPINRTPNKTVLNPTNSNTNTPNSNNRFNPNNSALRLNENKQSVSPNKSQGLSKRSVTPSGKQQHAWKN